MSFLFIACLLAGCTQKKNTAENRFRKGLFENSQFIENKDYEVFLPVSYEEEPERRYPVLYMMDLQNLFVDSLAYGGKAWNVHEVVDSLVAAHAMEEIIIVGLAHAGANRFSEYMPQKPVETFPKAYLDSVNRLIGKPVYSDDFLRFLVQEFKPQIDKTYRTEKDAEHTYIAGSSMGGLISMYALCEYPEVFGGALCLSTHWSISMDNSSPEVSNKLLEYFGANVPAGKKWYFDHGTEGLDQHYEGWQAKIDSILTEKGYVQGQNWISRKFEGHDHKEGDWNRRVHIPLRFAFQLLSL